MPVAVAFVFLKANGSEFLIRDFETRRGRVFVQCCLDRSACAGLGIPAEIDNDRSTHQRFATPVRRDVTQQALCTLVPCACSRWKMAYREASSDGIGQLLPRHLPHADAVSVPAARSRRHQPLCGFGIPPRAHRLPPATERLGSTRRGVMIHPPTHPAGVGREGVDPLRDALATLLVDKVLRAHLDRVPRGRPCVTGLLAIPEPCLLLRSNRYHGWPAFLKRPDLLVHRLEWRIAIPLRTAFLRLPIALSALAALLKHPGTGVVTDGMPWLATSVGEVTGALACPPHRRRRVPTRGRRQPRVEIREQGTVPGRHTSPSPAATAHLVSRWLMVLCAP